MHQNSKLYIVSHKELSPGSQASQLLHAAIEFSIQYQDIIKEWHNISNTIVLLTTSNEHKLKKLFDKAVQKNIKMAVFYEPDFNNALTAIAFEPTEEVSNLLRELPLALSNKVSSQPQ